MLKFKLTGDAVILRKLSSISTDLLDNIYQIMLDVAANVVRDAKANISAGRGFATGSLEEGVRFVPSNSGGKITITFESTEAYWPEVEFGIAPEGMTKSHTPPSSAIESWILTKGFGAGSRLKSLAFAIARKIGEEGTTPNPFIRNALDKNKADLINRIQKEITRAMK